MKAGWWQIGTQLRACSPHTYLPGIYTLTKLLGALSLLGTLASGSSFGSLVGSELLGSPYCVHFMYGKTQVSSKTLSEAQM